MNTDVNGMRLFIGGYGTTINGERVTLAGDRCFSAVHPVGQRTVEGVSALLDSGAFTDPPEGRLTPEGALLRQMSWEQKTRAYADAPDWCPHRIASYDMLIDETWVMGQRTKRRWSLKAAEKAVEETISAARYLSGQRERLRPRKLILSAQGVDCLQYAECAAAVLQHAQPGDWFGFGGWCILGLHRTLLPEFWRTIRLVLPMCRVAGVDHVHIFGVLWEKPLGGLLWLADEYGLTVSTDSSGPILACTFTRNPKKAGVRHPYWRTNVAIWQDTLANLRQSPFYREPPDLKPVRQMTLFNEVTN